MVMTGLLTAGRRLDHFLHSRTRHVFRLKWFACIIWCIFLGYFCSIKLFMNQISARGCFLFFCFFDFAESKEANGTSSVIMLHFLPRERQEAKGFFFFSFFLHLTYQVTHVLLWFGNVELHLVFNEELESQVVLGGIQLVGLTWPQKENNCLCLL